MFWRVGLHQVGMEVEVGPGNACDGIEPEGKGRPQLAPRHCAKSVAVAGVLPVVARAELQQALQLRAWATCREKVFSALKSTLHP